MYIYLIFWRNSMWKIHPSIGFQGQTQNDVHFQNDGYIYIGVKSFSIILTYNNKMV